MMKEKAGKKIILLVEDEAMIALNESIYLEQEGYSIISCSDGESAVSEIRKRDFDLILMDIDLGSGIDGTEAAKEIQSFSSVPIVFLSSHLEPEIVQKTEGITSYGYIVKNTVNTVLSASIKMAFKLHQANKELQESKKDLEQSELKHRMLYLNAPLPYQSLNPDGCFIDINPAWLNTLGYDRDEVIGKKFADFLHPDWKPHFLENFPAFKKRGYVHDVQFKIRHKKGHYISISFEGCIGYKPDGTVRQSYCVFKDITAQKLIEEENLLLMNELNHRVKNNLQMVTSLLRLKNSELADVADLSDLINQVDSIRLIHKHLEQNQNVASFGLKKYVEELISSVFETASQFDIRTTIDINDIRLPTRIVVSLGLVINEIATNAIKYGFRSDEESQFTIKQLDIAGEKQIRLNITNTGNKFPSDIDFETSKGLGLKLIRTLCHQHNGSIELIKEPDTSFIINIPL